MKDTSKNKKEREVLKRAQEFKYPTDRLGPSNLMIQESHINASRKIMVAHQLTHMVSIKDPEAPLVPTGFENVLAEYSHMLVKTDQEYEVVAKFVKNAYNYVLIGFNKKTRQYHAWKRYEAEEHSEGFATRYNNRYIDSLEPGDIIPEDTPIHKSTNFDKYGNYRYGKNVNTVYLVSAKVYEDQIYAMNGAEEMFNTFRAHTVEISLADNEVLLNWYGDDDHYQGFPMVGEKVRGGYAAIVRRIDNTKAVYALKKKRLRHPEIGDRKYYVTGRVVDIDIQTNKDKNKMIDTGATKLINKLYDEQQKFYRELYRFMSHIVDTADVDTHSYTDEFSTICAEAADYIDTAAYFADSNDTVFGNTKIVLHLLDEEKMVVGSKFVGRSGNKGVIGGIVPKEQSWHMEDGRPIHFVVATLGIIGRLNQSQLNEHSANELAATAIEAMKQTDNVDKKGEIVYRLLKYLNSDEAKSYKKWFRSLSYEEKVKTCKRTEKSGIRIVQEPIDNAGIMDFAEAYEEFKPNYQKIVFEDGSKSLRKVLCAKMFFFRLKQDPIEKSSFRSHGPVNPLTTLPAKSNLKKKFLIPFSDVAVRFGEMETEILLTMVNHPAAVANFMMENSTSYDAKLAIAEQGYMNDPDDDVDTTEITVSGKKNIEWISAMLNALSTDIEIEVEEAPEGEYFEG